MTRDELVEQISGFLVGIHESRGFELPATWSVVCRGGFKSVGTAVLEDSRLTVEVDWEEEDYDPSNVLHLMAVNGKGVVTTAQLDEGGLEPPSPRRLN